MGTRTSLVFLCIAALVFAAAGKGTARFLMTDYEIFEGDFLGLKSDTVHLRIAGDDGATVYKRIHKARFKGIMLPEGDILDLSLSDFEVEGAPLEQQAPISATPTPTDTADGPAQTEVPPTRDTLTTGKAVPHRKDTTADTPSASVPGDGAEDTTTSVTATDSTHENTQTTSIPVDTAAKAAATVTEGAPPADTLPASTTEGEAHLAATADPASDTTVSDTTPSSPRLSTSDADTATQSRLHVSSTPPGGTVYIDWEPVEGVTPVTVGDLSPGKKIVRIAKDTLVAAANVMVPPGKATTVELTLQPPTTELEIASTPAEARVYLGKRPPGKRARPDYITPAIHQDIARTSLHFHMSKEGYRDTTVEVMIVPGLTNAVAVTLQPVTAQAATTLARTRTSQRHRTIGTYLSIPSIACLATSTVLFMLAAGDHAEARDAKEFVERSRVAGSEVEAKIRQNDEAVSSGNAKLGAAFTLLGLGGGGLAAGLILRF
jgi:hypothetical protein